MKVGSLFSGVGGLDLGLERAGMTVIWQSEVDPYANRILTKHWSGIPNLGDITTIDWSTVEQPDLVCGGFPCQDISSAHTVGPNSRSGLTGPESSLWVYFSCAVATLRPDWVLVENVASGWTRWVPGVRQSLHHAGYASVPVEVSASLFGAPHHRARVLLVAYPYGDRQPDLTLDAEVAELRQPASHPWSVHPDPAELLRMDDGIPSRMDRCRVVGNAVVPQMAEWIGRQIMEADARFSR